MAPNALLQHRVAAPRLASGSRRTDRISISVMARAQQPRQQSRAVGGAAVKFAGIAAAGAVLLASGSAWAREQVAEFPTSGLIFK